MDNIIEIEHLCKSFGKIHAVQDLSFRVKAGELFAFLGVNGAGKSTTINMLCGELFPDSGSIRIGGKDISGNDAEVKATIGVVFQGSVLDRSLSVYDNLESRAACYGITADAFRTRLCELDALLDLSPLLHRTLKHLSGGQKRRVDIARALLHKPRILILDEPTTGLDPQTRKTLWSVIETLRRSEGITVFLTTHYMEEAADADYVVILDGGKIAAEGTPLALKSGYANDSITLYGVNEAEVSALKLPYQKLSNAFRISIKGTRTATELICAHPGLFCDYEILKGKMDDVFLAVTGKSLTNERQEQQ